MLKSIIARIVEGQDLSEEEAHGAMGLIMSGRVSEAQIAGFLVALRMKGETVAEITGCALAMREAATGIDAGDLPVVDTCGTGGDRKGTFNISTAAAIVAAGAGVPVAKHGNRSVSSGSGSADVLEALGVNIDAGPELVQRCLQEVGMGFLFAPLLHGAMKHAIAPRRALGVQTVFNILGPLTNPAGAKRQLLGIFSESLVEKIAGVLQRLGVQKAMVVHSADGMDEISVCGETLVAEVDPSGIEITTISPEALGVPRAELAALTVKDAADSAAAIRRVLEGEQGPRRDIVALNAGAAIYVGGRTPTLQEGLGAARDSIDSGRAARKLDDLVKVSGTPLPAA